MNDLKLSTIKIKEQLRKNKGQMLKNMQQSLFFILLMAIYAVILTFDNDNIILIISNISLNGLIAAVLIVKSNLISLNWKILLMLFSKGLSLVTITFLEKSNLLCVIYLIDNIQDEPSTLLNIEQTIIKTGSLILMCYKSNLISILVVSSVLLLQLVKIYIMHVKKEESQQFTYSPPSQAHLLPVCSQIIVQTEEIWKNRMSILPISMLVVSMRNLSIIYKNQCFYNFFSQFCKSEEEFEDFVMNKLSFTILNNNQQDQEVSSINEIIKKSIKKQQRQSQVQLNHYSSCMKNQETLQDFQMANQSLNDILQNFKSKNILSFLNFNQIYSFELNCSQELSDGLQVQIFGQIVQNDKDDEILIFLNDISNQNDLQENLLMHNFKSKILQSFSHELRTPLNSAMNFLASTLNETKLPGYIKSTLIEPAYYSLKLQSSLINDIIDFSSFYQDQVTLTRRDFAVQDLISEISLMFFYQFQNKQLAFDIDLTDYTLIWFNTDYNKLLQILVNLIQNSLKYCERGGCILKLINSSNSNIQFIVADQGLGIKQDMLLQLKRTLETNERKKDFVKDWHGIGLLISSILLEKLAPPENNHFEIQSEGENKGTKITFEIQNYIKIPNSKQNIRCSTSNYLNFGSGSSQSKITGSQQIQINSSLYNVMGTVLKNTEFHITTCQYKTQTLQFPQYPSKKSQNDSMFSESNDDYLERRLDDLESFSPFLITDINNVFNKIKDKSSRVINLKYLKRCEERESEIFISGLNSLKKCNCLRILSVDDEIFNQKSLQILISQLGFEVLLAFNGQQAISIVQSLQKCCPTCNLLTLILMDYQMPIMDGLEATRQLIKLMNNQQIPQIHIVGLTAFTNKRDIESCIQAGMSDVLSKPFDLKEFKKILVYIYNEYRKQSN